MVAVKDLEVVCGPQIFLDDQNFDKDTKDKLRLWWQHHKTIMEFYVRKRVLPPESFNKMMHWLENYFGLCMSFEEITKSGMNVYTLAVGKGTNVGGSFAVALGTNVKAMHDGEVTIGPQVYINDDFAPIEQRRASLKSWRDGDLDIYLIIHKYLQTEEIYNRMANWLRTCYSVDIPEDSTA